MFIRYYLDLTLPFAQVEHALLADPASWLPGLANDADDRSQRLLIEVGFEVGDDRRVDRQVQIEVGEPYTVPAKTMLPIAWKASNARALPQLDADIEIASLGANRTQLSISARYRPPLGALGRALDRALLHRVAEATVKDFLDRVGERIGARASSRVEG